MNSIGEGIQEIKSCSFCQKIINENFKEWELKAKEAQEELKKAVYCEHKGTWERELYDKDKNHTYTWNPKGYAEGKARNYFCTNSCCITADNGTRPDLVIYEINGYGDEWKDPNHTFKKVEQGFGKGSIEDIKCLSEECKKSDKKTCKECVAVGGQCHKCSQKGDQKKKNSDKDDEKDELIKSQNYFQNNDIDSITREENKWIITYKDGRSADFGNVPELKGVENYLKSVGKNALTAQELNMIINNHSLNNENRTNKPTNYWPWIIGSITILAILAGIYLYLRKNKEESNEL